MKADRARIVLYVATSLDGYIADPDGKLDWLTSFGIEDEEYGYSDLLEGTGVLAMGSATYEWILNETEEWPYEQPTWIFSRRDLRQAESAELKFVSGPPADFIPGMSEVAKGKSIWLVGGGDLVNQFIRADLLDEVIHFVVPKALGGGIPLYPEPVPDAFEVESTRSWPSGMIELHYRPSG